MVWSFVDVALSHLLQLVVLLGRSERSKELEILLLRHELAILRRQRVRELAGDLGGDVASETRRDDYAEDNVRLRLRAVLVRGSGPWLRRRLDDRSLVSAGLAPG